MKLIIDIGNTRIKAALFEDDEIKETFVFNSSEEFFTANLFEKFIVSNCIIGTVVNETEEFIEKIKSKTNTILFTNETKIPIKNLYQSIHTLGSDRLAGAVGGNYLFPGKDVLIIDGGTCVKYNFVNNKNEFIGGAISPGIEMRFKAMNEFTSRLPLVKADENFTTLIGKNSYESILSGVMNGVISEVQGFIEEYKKSFPDLTIVVTGGNANFFANRLKKPIFADPNLILKGLNRILDYNL